MEIPYREKVFEIVRSIPRGRLMTYGQIAVILGEGYTARTVGYVMHSASSEDVPWQRVVNSSGGCSTSKFTVPFDLQQKLLEQEGVKFSAKAKCRLDDYLWSPDGFEEDDEKMSLFE
ncbi:MAG: MGMT family protein [Acidobacteria bacterium]|nr:MGMT family protein [Acidobacteriota bacterium]MBK8147673.1 MGMT family protein [Acidobacteriota bacterium]